MIIGVPKEIKDNEFRVAATPAGVESLVSDGHRVLIETGAGEGSGITDEVFRESGAELAEAWDVWRPADLVLKIKEPLPSEYGYLVNGKTLFTYLHLSGVPGLADALCDSGVTAVAYETVELDDGSFPLLAPMSEIAGRLAVMAGAHYLERPAGGKGKLLGGIPGTAPARVVVVGAGTVGQHAARLAMACGASVTLLNRGIERLRQFMAAGYPGALETRVASPSETTSAVAGADVVIGAVYVGGMRAARVISREMVRSMETGSVLVDVSIDQGGCAETSRPTNYSSPVYIDEGVTHYCVANMPGAVPWTATPALTNATLPYVRIIAGGGIKEAFRSSPALARGVNVYRGHITHRAVAESLGRADRSLAILL